MVSEHEWAQPREILLLRGSEGYDRAGSQSNSRTDSQVETFYTADSSPQLSMSKILKKNNKSVIPNQVAPPQLSDISSPLNTSLYITAKTSISTADPTNGLIPDSDHIYLRTAADDNIHFNFSAIAHSPPYLPSARSRYARFGKSTLRQSIIQRQSVRLSPLNDRLTDHMEEQMIRWRPPNSSYQADDILNGKHPFQKAQIKTLEAIKAEASTDSGSTTDSSVKSIAKSPFIQTDPEVGNSMKRNHPSQCTFREQNQVKTPNEHCKEEEFREKANDNESYYSDAEESIQDSTKFRIGPLTEDSASESSSIMKKLNEEHMDGENDLDNFNELPSATTFPAAPIELHDVEQLLKENPLPVNQLVFDQNLTPNPLLEFEDENKTCWPAVVQAWGEVWSDCVDIFTCPWDDLEEALIARVTLYNS